VGRQEVGFEKLITILIKYYDAKQQEWQTKTRFSHLPKLFVEAEAGANRLQ
jgi:hypothetical protein